MRSKCADGTGQRISWVAAGGDTPLLESLLKTLDRAPERLDAIKRLLDDIRASGDPDEMLPEGFQAVWEAVWAIGPCRRTRCDGVPPMGCHDSSSGNAIFPRYF